MRRRARDRRRSPGGRPSSSASKSVRSSATARSNQSSGSTGTGLRSTTESVPAAGSPSNSRRYWPESACQRPARSFTITSSATALIERPESGIDSGSVARKAFTALAILRLETLEATSACAVRSTMRSWNENRSALRAPRSGATNPAFTSARIVCAGSAAGARRRERHKDA